MTYRIMVRIGAAVSVAIGCAALAGWLLELPRLTSLGRGLIPMAPSTALLFVAYGGALLLACCAPSDRRAMRFILSIFASGGFISAALFFISIRDVFLDIEHLGIHAIGAVDGSPIGHMSPIAAVTFLLFSMAFPAVLTSRPKRAWMTKSVWWIAVLLIAVYIMLILAYFFGTPMFYGDTFIPPAATTSLAFIAFGISLAALSRPMTWPEADARNQEARHSSTVLIIVFILLAAGIISAGYFYHRNHQKQYLAGVERQLSAIADLKMGELLLWREERTADAGIFYRNAAFASLVKACLQHPMVEQPRREIKTWVGTIQKNHNYNRIFLLDAHGKIRLSLPDIIDEPLSPSVSQKAVESLRTRRITFVDFYRNEFNGKIFLSILVPIFDPAREGDALGVLAMRIDPDIYLYPFIKRWPNASTTAETLLVRRDGNEAVFLNELRFIKNTELNLRVPVESTENPAVMAALGREGGVRGIDYRGHRVIAVLRNIPDSPWHLVTRMDVDEIYAPMWESLWVTVLLISAMLMSAGTGVGFVWRQRSVSYYKSMSNQSALLRSIIDSIPDLIFYKDTNSVYLGCNKAFERFAGRPEQEQVGKTDFDFFDSEVAEFFRQKDCEMLEGGQARSNEELITYPDGRRVLLDTLKTPFWGPDGTQLGLVGISRDITERKQVEEERKFMLQRQQGINLLQKSLIASAPLDGKLKSITDSIVQLFDADFCRIWLIRPGDLCEQGCIHAEEHEEPHVCRYRDRCLHLLASSGRYTHTDGKVHRRVPFGCYKIGRVASGEEHKFICNDVLNDPRIHDREWARDLGLESFAGYQLRIPDGEVIGVLALFAKHSISPDEDALLDGLGSAVALVIQQSIAEEARKQKEREIEKKNAELERFTYTVSHDLKSPLVTIKTFLGYLEEDIKLPDNPRVQQDLGFMHNAADKMSQLLDELLELSRVGRINNPPQKIAFVDLVNEAVRLDAGRISERGVTVEVIGSPVILFGDRARLVEIWQNLVENAVKYIGNEPAPFIEVGCAIEDGAPVFFVRDNGIGIDPRYHEKVFSLFDKLDPSSEGTGLGLALVKRIVEIYGGRIWVESKGVGHGSCFWFTLPEAVTN